MHWVNIRMARWLGRLMHDARLPLEPLKEIRKRKLRRLLISAYESHGFYRRLMEEAAFNPYEFQNMRELERLPIVNRTMYRNFTEEALQRHPGAYASWFRDATSGSTGQPLPVLRTWDERAYMLAKFLRLMVLNGYRPRDVAYWIVSPNHMRERDSLLQVLGFMRRHIAPYSEPTDSLVARLLALQPEIVYANKSHLVQMALHVKRQGLSLVRPKLCLSVGETLDAVSQTLIQDVFGAEGLIDAYGALEFSNLAYRRVKDGGPYVFNHDTDILEVVDGQGCPAREGTVLITDLHIHSFPLIRYKLGDQARIEFRDGLPLLHAVIGRADDVIRLRDGRTCAGPIIEVIMEKHPAIVQYRIIQESYDRLRVVIAAKDGTDTPRLERDVTADLRRLVAPEADYRFEFVPCIPPDPNGKLRMLISKVTAPPP